MKKRFFIYNSWQPTIELLTTEEKAEMLMNFFRYQNNQPLILNTSGLKMAWASFQYLLDKDSVNYETKRTTMAENRAKRNITDSDVSTNNSSVNTNSSTNKINVSTSDLNVNTNALSDNVNVNVNVNVNDNVNGDDGDNENGNDWVSDEFEIIKQLDKNK
jgi:hypothetical protein